jgi:cytosine/creatinine deaminase
MLVLSRQRDQSVIIGEDTEVRVVDVRGDKVRLGFIAPRNVSVHRKEVYDLIRRENQSAAQVMPEDLTGLRAPAPPPKPVMRLVPQDLSPADLACLRAAVDEAKLALSEGGMPAGAVLVRNGEVIGRGRNRHVQNGDPTAHAELDALRHAGRQTTYADTTLYTTLAPCLMCAGAAAQFGIKRIVVGDAVSLPAGESVDLLRAHDVDVIDAADAECVEMMSRFVRDNPGQ